MCSFASTHLQSSNLTISPCAATLVSASCQSAFLSSPAAESETDDVRKFSYKNQDMAKLNSALGIKSSYYGWYAQLPESGDWDGAQLLSQLDDVKASVSLPLLSSSC